MSSSTKDNAPRPPSKDVEPTKIDTAPQQTRFASPLRSNRNDPNINVVEIPAEIKRSPTFKEQVFGYAKVIRGTALGKSDVKEHGEQVLRGEETIPVKGRRGSIAE
ncbi:uncharacterized protein EDB93DRAFT_1250634 [Suillus bovinus]|uniref:uncharacterized protein n=1 Tax=Suillus bovinus TaxID=48563 RepID=UPI001B860FAC|nr:uncharacterized protein EDB93DRAFT_1250634 [Suillus bovinus]KAG2147489.1 hypothetical protein EDB93DRAFT_1250634 [Suillus bovinus]